MLKVETAMTTPICLWIAIKPKSNTNTHQHKTQAAAAATNSRKGFAKKVCSSSSTLTRGWQQKRQQQHPDTQLIQNSNSSAATAPRCISKHNTNTSIRSNKGHRPQNLARHSQTTSSSLTRRSQAAASYACDKQISSFLVLPQHLQKQVLQCDR